MKIKKAVIPAGGLGTRFLPATKSLAKEMLPIVDKPCIQYLVEEAVKSGIEEIIIITSGEKKSIENHFNFSSKLYNHLQKNKKVKALQEIRDIEKMAKIHFVTQKAPLGDGHAILCAKKFLNNEAFAVLFGDDIYDSKTPALKQLITIYKKFKTPVVGLQKIDKKDSDKYGIIDVFSNSDKIYKVKDLVEKPIPKKAPSNLAIIGKYIITPDLLKDLESAKPGKDKELRLIDGMRKFIQHSPIYGYEIEGQRFDTGDKLGYLKAQVHFGLKHKELQNNFIKYLKSLI